MKERDIFEEIVNLGKRRGVLTYDEINEALPSELFSPNEIEDLMDVLSDMGVKVVDYEEGSSAEEEIEEEVEEAERAEDLVQAYFNSMGDISILTKYEETELAKKLEEGKGIIKETISGLPLYTRILETSDTDEEDEEFLTEEERADEALIKTLSRLEDIMEIVGNTGRKIKKYGDLK